MAVNGATQLFFFPSLLNAMSCFYILCTPRPVACSRAESVCVSVCMCARAPLALPGFPALLFQPGVSNFWFPLGLSGNWKQRLSLEVCFVSQCVCVRTCTHPAHVCVLPVCIFSFIYLFIFLLLFTLLMHVCIHFRGCFCVFLCGQPLEFTLGTVEEWNMSAGSRISLMQRSWHAQPQAWPGAVQLSGYL